MATNIEIKARVADPRALQKMVETLADRPGELLQQVDVFFHSPTGRLKLRDQGQGSGQLIFYNRPDDDGPKASEYQIYFSDSPGRLRALLSTCLGERGVVRKKRWLYWVGDTRIHLDEVAGLGTFLEFEVVLQPGQAVSDGEAIAHDLCARLDIHPSSLVKGAYIDLLEVTGRDPGGSQPDLESDVPEG